MAKKKTKKQIFLDKINAPGFKPYEIVNGNVVWNHPYRFPDAEESFRPKCINYGCNNPVTIFRGTMGELKGREIRTVCNHCHLASYGETSLKLGVIAHKKTYCENRDGHLGFPCTSTIHFPGNLELDHIDGNHFNNIPSNIQTLCKICHSYKSHLNGDNKKSPKEQRSMALPPESISSPILDSVPSTKNYPNLQNTIPYTEWLALPENQAFPGIPSIGLSGLFLSK